MSLNTPLKRPDFQGENVTSPSLSAGGTTADSDSSGHTLQQVSGTSADGDMPGDLWAQAYTALDPAVIETYEQILLAQDAKSKSGQAAVSHQQQEELWKMAKNALEDIDLVEWKEHISYSVNIDEFDKVVRVVIAAKDFVSSAVDAEAHAILVWAGVCIFLPLLVNTPVQKWTVDGLQAISAALHRIQVLQGQIEPDDYDAEAGSLLQDFKNSTVELYEAVIEFQIRLVEYSYNRVNRYARVHEANEWQLTKRINDLEGDCTRAARLLSRSRIDQALRGSHRKTDYILYKIRDGLEKPTRGIEPQILQTIWRQIDKERDCIELFRLSTPYEDQKNRTPTRAPETGRWFLEHRRFIDWRDSAGPGLLWLSGEPGSGKSVLARAVIDEGFAISSQQEQTAVCYFFFKDISSYHRSAESAVAAILHQLFSAFPSLVEHAMFSYRFNGTHLLSLFDDMFNILCQAAADPAVGQVVCVLDTTDECSDDARISPITAIASFYRKAKVASNPKSESKLKFLLTSRPCSDMYSQLHDLIQENPAVHLPANDECENIRDEINHVIDARVPGLASQRGFSGEAARYLVQQLHSVDNPTYLWLTLIMEEIRLLQRPANDLEARQIIQALPRSLPDAFDAIMMRSTNVDLARKLLHIILAAREPLTVKDISIATALADNPRYCSYEELEVEKSGLFKMGIKDICGLVTIQDGHVFLIHQTLKEFLLHQDDTENSGMWKYSFDRTDSEALMVTICIALLPFPCFSENLLTAGEGSDERRGYIDHGFLRYAALYWTDHAQEAELGDDEKWTEELTALCSVGKPICKTWYTIYQASNQTFPRDITSLNLAAQLRFTNVLTVLLNSGEDPNEPDGHGQTPLARSVEVQSLKAVERLLDAGANVDAQVPEEPWYNTDNEPSEIEFSPCSGTPLTRAVYSGNLGMVKCLLDRGATVDLVPEGSRTPLCAAIDMCSANSEGPDICRLLVQRGANVSIGLCLGEYNDKIIITALHAAAGNCIPPSVLCDLLQSETADVNFKTRAIDDVQAGLELDDIDGLPVSQLTGVTALHLAIQGGFVQNVEILLEHGADMHIRDSRGQTAMHHALCLPELDKSPPTRKMVISLLEQYDGLSDADGTSSDC